MNWCSIILLVFSLSAPFAHPDDAHSCGKTEINNVIKNVKILKDKWEDDGDLQEAILQKLGLKLKEIMTTSENAVGHCTPEENLEFEHAVQFVSNMLSGETDPAEKVLPLVDDVQVLDDVTKLICELNCTYVAEFANQIKSPAVKIRIYQTLTKHLQGTTRPNFPLVKFLNRITHQENDASVEEVLNTLMRQAITTELNMEFGSVEELYEMDYDLTSEIMQQVIHEGLIAQEKYVETGTSILHVYQLIKCHQNISLWLHNLELIFNEVKNTNKLNTINSVILLVYYKAMQMDKEFDAHICRWHDIAKELPERAHKIASGDWCSKVEAGESNAKTYFSLSGVGTDAKKLVPSDHNTKSAFTVVISGAYFTILVDYLPSSDYKFELPVEVEHGNLVPLPKEENNQATSYECQPIERILLQGNDEPESWKLKKLIESLLNAA